MDTTPTPQQHLQHVIDHWADLTAALAAPTTSTWPPAGLAAHLNTLAELGDASLDQLRHTRALDKADRQGDAPGERPVPIRVHVHDLKEAIEHDLVELADQIADQIQRPVAPRVRAAGPDDDIGLFLSTASMRDAADPRRWSWSDPLRRTAPYAAAWLLHRLTGADGPVARLNDRHRTRIARTAASASERIMSGLEMTRRRRPVNVPCPHCRGPLVVEGGDGQPPEVRCGACGWARHSTDESAA